MSRRFVVAGMIVLSLVLSTMPLDYENILEKDIIVKNANSEPQFLTHAGSNSGHVNASFIESTIDGWIVAGATRNSMQFGSSISETANSPLNNNYEADMYIAKIGDDGVWQWADIPDASGGLIFLETMAPGQGGEYYVGGSLWEQCPLVLIAFNHLLLFWKDSLQNSMMQATGYGLLHILL